MSRRPAIHRVTAAAFVEQALAKEEAAPPPQGPPVEAAAGAGAGPERHGAASKAQTLLALFDRDTPEDRRIGRVLAQVAAQRAERVRVLAVAAADLQPQLDRWQEARRSYDTFDFRRWPAVGVFRGGRLITTFHPRLVFFDERLQEREEREQLEVFLSKMVYFDPAAVKEQKNLELATGG